MGEFDLIERFFRPLARASAGALDLRDDAALLDPPAGRQLVLTADTIVEGIHFLPSDPPESAGAKVLAVNLSDLAAMGAEPLGYLLSVALPHTWPAADREAWLAGMTLGLSRMQTEHRVSLLGGDTVATTGPAVLTVAAMGCVEPGAALRRSTARPGDAVYVSGMVGDAALGLKVLQGSLAVADDGAAAMLIERYRFPRPRLALGQRLVGIVHAAADVSDGLIADLGNICRASGVAATIDAGLIPLSPPAATALAADQRLLAAILTGGDDYELVFTASSAAADALADLAVRLDTPVTRIGAIQASDAEASESKAGDHPVRVLVGGRFVPVGACGFDHFA